MGNFTHIMRKLCGWHWEVDRTLCDWVNKTIRDSFLE